MEKNQEVFNALREILLPYAPHMTVVYDTDDNYYLDCTKEVKKDMPMFFASVRINKSYVSYHLMPVYVKPDLMNSVSADLRIRMQGKSCFNFSEVDTAVFAELAKLTQTGYELFREKGYAE